MYDMMIKNRNLDGNGKFFEGPLTVLCAVTE